MTTIYIVTVNGKVSQEAYQTLLEAQDFVKSRINYQKAWNTTPYYRVTNSDGVTYEINDVKVA